MENVGSDGPCDAVDRVADMFCEERAILLRGATLEQYVSFLEEWIVRARERLSPALIAQHPSTSVSPGDYAMDDLHWNISCDPIWPDTDLEQYDPYAEGVVWASLWHRDGEVITLEACRLEGEEIWVRLQCMHLWFYPVYVQLASLLEAWLYGSPIPPISVLEEPLRTWLWENKALGEQLRTDLETFHAWLTDEAARTVAWMETDVLGFYEHEFRLDQGAQGIAGTWRYIRRLWERDWRPTSDMVGTVMFLYVICSDRVDPPMFLMNCMDERFRAPCLRLLASALREFPVDESSAEAADQYVEYAQRLDQAAPVRTIATQVVQAELGRLDAPADTREETPERVHLLASPKEYFVWLTRVTGEGGLFPEYEAVEWEHGHILLRAREVIWCGDKHRVAGMRVQEATRPIYVFSLVLEGADKGLVGIVVTASYLARSSAYLDDFYRVLRASLSQFDGSRLPSLAESVEGGTAAGPPSGKQLSSESVPPVSDSVWMDALVYAPILQREPNLSNAEVAARANRKGPQRDKPYDAERVRYVRNTMRDAFGNGWWQNAESLRPSE